MGMSELVKLVFHDKAAWISIERPKALNALSWQVIGELDQKLDEALQNREIRALVVKSAVHFASGADISEMADLGPEEACRFSFSPVYAKLEQFPLPTLAAMEGFALGGGLELALACDLRIATRKAVLGFPEISLGIFPGAGGTVRLPRTVGMARAKEMILLGQKVRGDRALEIGLVSDLCEEGELEEKTLFYVKRFASLSRTALEGAKRSLNDPVCREAYQRAMEKEREIWSALFVTEDQKEGMGAFLEKRAPVFRDC